jgi:hypothetical protein
MEVLQHVEQRASRVVEPNGLAGQPLSVLLVIGQEMQHGRALLGQATVGLLQIAENMDKSAAAPFTFLDASLEKLDAGKQTAKFFLEVMACRICGLRPR